MSFSQEYKDVSSYDVRIEPYKRMFSVMTGQSLPLAITKAVLTKMNVLNDSLNHRKHVYVCVCV